MSKRNTITELKLCTNYNRTWHGLKIPKGAYYGTDARSHFAIWEYRVCGKTGFYHGMPRLKIWRNISGHWIQAIEASPTTYGIMSKLEEWDDVPEVSWGEGKFTPSQRKVKSCQLTDCADFEYYGRKLPKNAAYGYDQNGVFICTDYRLKGGDNGYRRGLPCLTILRPTTYEKESNYRITWRKSVEANGTTFAIWNLIQTLKNQEVEYDLAAEASEIASRNDLRPNKDVTPYMKSYLGGSNSPKGASYLAAEIPTGLDKIAARQKGKPAFVGTLVTLD